MPSALPPDSAKVENNVYMYIYIYIYIYYIYIYILLYIYSVTLPEVCDFSADTQKFSGYF